MDIINGLDELDSFIINSQNKIILLYFGAIWCEPCKKLKNRLENEETKIEMPNLSLCYIDIDNQENEEIISTYKIKLLPTLIYVNLDSTMNVKIISRIDGYDWIKIIMEYKNIKFEN